MKLQTQQVYTSTYTTTRKFLYRGIAQAQSIPVLREPLANTHDSGAHSGEQRLFTATAAVGVSLLKFEVTMVTLLRGHGENK